MLVLDRNLKENTGAIMVFTMICFSLLFAMYINLNEATKKAGYFGKLAYVKTLKDAYSINMDFKSRKQFAESFAKYDPRGTMTDHYSYNIPIYRPEAWFYLAKHIIATPLSKPVKLIEKPCLDSGYCVNQKLWNAYLLDLVTIRENYFFFIPFLFLFIIAIFGFVFDIDKISNERSKPYLFLKGILLKILNPFRLFFKAIGLDIYNWFKDKIFPDLNAIFWLLILSFVNPFTLLIWIVICFLIV